jgi:hypothetical protein
MGYTMGSRPRKRRMYRFSLVLWLLKVARSPRRDAVARIPVASEHRGARVSGSAEIPAFAEDPGDHGGQNPPLKTNPPR